ncbi:MAG TPA: elongation factor P maturation arginine rhamnosyltransferase EarP, partial [Rhodocyclaceae bacterium]|nr:elongation factor P maturation arginine rhamnosyltransferase EarP [Rhodocyclaceae bacterium]
FGDAALSVGTCRSTGRLTVRVLPFVGQDDYDRLLWSCELNFVRGEDSFVRAQWAARPFVWQIYPQHDAAHLAKLEAFLTRFAAGLHEPAATALRTFWQAWNRDDALAGEAPRAGRVSPRPCRRSRRVRATGPPRWPLATILRQPW